MAKKWRRTSLPAAAHAPGALNKSLQSKFIIPLRDPGEYTVEVRDTTADLGDAGFQYRVMIRQQVPHLGQIKIDDDA
jgi:hypothetical protein